MVYLLIALAAKQVEKVHKEKEKKKKKYIKKYKNIYIVSVLTK